MMVESAVIAEQGSEWETTAVETRRRRSSSSAISSRRFSSTLMAFTSSLFLTSTVLFSLTTILGFFVAYDKPAAFDRLLLIGAGLFVAFALGYLNRVTPHEGAVATVCVAAAWGAAALGLLFLLVSPWPDRLPAVAQSTAMRVQAWVPNQQDGVAINTNVAASALVVLIGLGFGGTLWLWTRSRLFAALTALPLALAGLALLSTLSRGGILGLALGGLCAGYLYLRTGIWRHKQWRKYTDIGVATAVFLFLAGLFGVMLQPTAVGSQASALFAGGGMSRSQIWRAVLPLVADYRFTGSGLAGSMPILSAYTFLLHVGFLTHAHSLYLQIALSQGLPGLIGFLGMVAGALTASVLTLRHGTLDQRNLVSGALVALVALLVHGLVGSGFYASLPVPALFLPFGVIGALFVERRSARQRRFDWRPVLLGAFIPLSFVFLLFVLPGARSAFQANLGAVSQTALEQRTYQQPTWRIQDEIRRSHRRLLEPSLARYGAALHFNPENVSANRRVGQIAISMGELETAQQHLERAYSIAPDQRATRQMLGEVYAVQGRTDEAVQLWQTIDTSAGQLQARQWWWETYGTPAQHENFTAALTQLSATPGQTSQP